jgi:CheY-like chemotaxis protein
MEAMKKILVVDDDPVVGRSFDRVLTRKGYAVITATNGQDALEKLRNERYDMVFTDIKMPGMSGLEVAERVKASQPWLPVVIVTGYGNDASQARAAAAGVSAFLHKPLSPEMIEGSAEQALRQAVTAPVAEAAVVAPAPAEPRRGALKSAAMLIGAPIAGLAFVVAAPFIGFATLLWMAARALAAHGIPQKAARFAKNVALFLSAPVIGLAYLVAFPVIGLGMIAWMGIKALDKHEKTRQAVLFVTAPLIGLCFVLFAPIIGLVALAKTGMQALRK